MNEIELNDIKVRALSQPDRRARLFNFTYITHELFHGTETTMSICVHQYACMPHDYDYSTTGWVEELEIEEVGRRIFERQ